MSTSFPSDEERQSAEPGTSAFALQQLPTTIHTARPPCDLVNKLSLEMGEVKLNQCLEREAAHCASIIQPCSDPLQGIVTSWNQGAERGFGYSAEEVHVLGRIRDKSVEHYENVRVVEGGRRIDISLTVSPIGFKVYPSSPTFRATVSLATCTKPHLQASDGCDG